MPVSDNGKVGLTLFRVAATGGEHPVPVVVEVAVERRDTAVVHEPERVGGRGQQVTVVRDDDERAVEILQRLGQRLAHLDVEVVGRLVENQELRLRAHDHRQHEPRLLPSRKPAGSPR